MKDLFIKKMDVKKTVGLEEANHLIEAQAIAHPVQELNWKDYPYLPGVSFRIGHVGNGIWLKYYVAEKYILARETRTNGDVYKDSCVEFFISFDETNYYNFECKAIGTIHLAYGPDRNNRKFVPEATVQKIETFSSLGNQPFHEKKGEFHWEILVRIPLECFAFSDMNTLSGRKAKGNFYKCGDETSEPHFISWNPIRTETPDFHQPGFFGNLVFE